MSVGMQGAGRNLTLAASTAKKNNAFDRSLELLDVVIRNNSPETKRNEQKTVPSGMLGGNAKECGVVCCSVCVSLSVFADQSDDQITGEETDE